MWIEDRGVVAPRKGIKTGPRVGVAYAGWWAGRPYRFILEHSLDTSRRADKLVPMTKRFVSKKSKKRSGGG
jgi:hypothetical protein